MAVSGARVGEPSLLGRLASRMLASDLTAFVVPDAATARARGLDLAAAGLCPIVTPRHAMVLVVVGELPAGLCAAAAVAYAQMPRPRVILAIDTGSIAPLPDPDVAVPAEQAALARAVGELRQLVADAAFSPAPKAFDVGALRTETTYTCPMHPEIVRDGPGKCPICGMNLIPQQEVGRQSGQHEGMAMEPGPRMAHGAMAGVAAGADERAAEDGYACAVHPEVVGRAPGACPICGMDLVPRAAGDAARGAEHAAHGSAGTFTCPMHPEIVRDRPGSCPLCGMDLVPRDAPVAGPTHKPAEEQSTAAAQGDYTCPMHPEVSGDTPGSCPSCGMDLVPRRASGTPGDSQAEHPAHTVPGDYTCPMHPEVTRDAPGSCPICGMDLMPRGRPDNGGTAAPKQGADAHPTSYSCPMHPEIVRDGPGSCPICGMDLVTREETGGGEATPPHPHAGHRAAPADDPPRPGGAVAPGHADHPAAVGDTAADHAGHGDHGSASHGGRATTTAEGAGGMDHGAMGHGGMTATAPPHPATPANLQHGGAARAAHAMGGVDPPHDNPGLAAGDMAAMGHSIHGTGGRDRGGHDTGAHEMGGTGDMDHPMHAMGGFMSMVALTRDLPRSRDGLPMEWAEVPFGPLSPGLPGGLALALTLDGDVVARATRAEGAVRRGLAATWPGPRETFPDRLARLDPLTPVAYRLLAQGALETAAGLVPSEQESRARIAALERERAASHLGWLAGFAELLGIGWLAERSAALQLALARAADPDALVPLRGEARRLAAGVERLPLLRRRLATIGRPGETAERRGPVARAAGVTTDARAADPAYRALGFAPRARAGDDALARLLVRLAEIGQSLDLAIAAGGSPSPTPPQRPGTDGGEHGTATVETPRGAATLHLLLDAGAVREAHLDAPSGAHAPLIAAVTEGRELADALVGVASLDLSPWELDR